MSDGNHSLALRAEQSAALVARIKVRAARGGKSIRVQGMTGSVLTRAIATLKKDGWRVRHIVLTYHGRVYTNELRFRPPRPARAPRWKFWL